MSDKAYMGIVCSHSKEAAAAASVLKQAKKQRFSLFTGYTGFLSNRKTVIIESGMGGDRSYIAAKQLIPLYKPEILLDFGVAAGVSAKLSPGDVAIIARAYDMSAYFQNLEKEDPFISERHPIPESAMHNSITANGIPQKLRENPEGAFPANSASADYFLNDSFICKELQKRGVDVFTFETYSLFQAASEAKIPFFGLRVISDRGDEKAGKDFRRNLRKALNNASLYLKKISAPV